MPSRVWIDGQIVDKYDARISIFDHGLLYGDGAWQGMRIARGQVPLLSGSLAQLRSTCDRLHLTIPVSSDELARAVTEMIQVNRLHRGYVRIIITRGAGTLGHDPRKCEPAVIIIAEELGLYPRELIPHGIPVITLTVDPGEWLGNVLGLPWRARAKGEALRQGHFEALLVDPAGSLLGATEMDSYAIVAGRLVIPPSDRPGIDESLREFFATSAETISLAVERRVLSRTEIDQIEEVFLAGSAGEMIAISQIDGRNLGSQGQGVWTGRLHQLYDQEFGSLISPADSTDYNDGV